MKIDIHHYKEPLVITLKVMLAVALIELTIMIVITGLKGIDSYSGIIIDVVLLCLVGIPVIMFFVISPLLRKGSSEIERQQSLAMEDPLTHLPNRRFLSDYLDKSLAGHERYKQIGALLYFDLDGFKEVNDLHGHEVGDTVLKEIAERLRDRFRSEDVICRIGGDEFVLLLQNIGENTGDAKTHIYAIANKLLKVIKEPFFIYGHRFDITCSIGVKVLDKSRIASALVIREADMAMYKAKQHKELGIVFAEDITLNYYGMMSTFVPEIDREHNEIDALIEEAFHTKIDQVVVVQRLIRVLKRHFKSEVSICKRKTLNMTREHIEEHTRLTKVLNELKKTLNDQNSEELLKSIQSVVKDHILNFDRMLVRPDKL